jgi:ribosome-binding protein aMBF1 (putative translation factor)
MGKLKELLLGTREQQINREQMLEMQLNAHYNEQTSYLQEWEEGKRTPLNSTTREFEYIKQLKNGC